MYEFVVLSLLASKPMHGYGIRQVMNRIIGPYRSCAWGPLYTMLRKLQQSGLIESASDEQAGADGGECRGGPPCKRFQITVAGRARFQELMRVPLEPEPDYKFTFAMKVSHFGHVTPEQRLALLRDYRRYCQAHLDHVAEQMRTVAAESTQISVFDQPWILLTQDRLRALWQADAAWVDARIATLEQGEQPRVALPPGTSNTANDSEPLGHGDPTRKDVIL